MTAAQIMCGSGRERGAGSDCAEVVDEGVVLMVRVAVAGPVAGANEGRRQERVRDCGQGGEPRPNLNAGGRS
jgi:hypothetical protein